MSFGYVDINAKLPKVEQEVVYIDKENFWCDGGEDYGHPRVYYTMKNGEAVCGYCNRKYVLKMETDE